MQDIRRCSIGTNILGAVEKLAQLSGARLSITHVMGLINNEQIGDWVLLRQPVQLVSKLNPWN